MRTVPILVLALVQSSIARAEPARPAVLALSLPSRAQGAKDRSHRIDQVAARVAAKLSVPLASAAKLQPRVDLTDRLEEARTLWMRGSVDDSAVILDLVIEDGVRQQHRLDRPAELVTATLSRVSIALARGEEKRGRALLGRLLRHDPAVQLDGDENTPNMKAALDAARHTAPDPPRPDELGDACRDYAVVLAGRIAPPADPTTGAPVLELFRYDDCKLVARVRLTGDSEDQLSPLLEPPLALAVRIRAERQPGAAPDGRGYRLAGLVTVGFGLVLGGIGTAYGFKAANRANEIEDACQPQAPCSEERALEGERDLDSARFAAGALWISGGAAVVAGGVLYFVGTRNERRSLAAGTRLVVTPTEIGLAWGKVF